MADSTRAGTENRETDILSPLAIAGEYESLIINMVIFAAMSSAHTKAASHDHRVIRRRVP
jgi:hypothetical protein